MKYVLDIVKGDQTLARRNGPVCISRPASFNLLLGHHKGLVKVYRRDVDIPYEIDFQNGANGRLGLHLTDPWGKEIWKGEIEPQGFKTGRIPLKGLALGHYKVKAVLGDEIQTAGFDIFENPNWREVFYITPNGGALDTDSPEELAAKFKTMADAGITRHGATDPWRLDMLLWPGRHLRMTGDIVLRTGMQTGHADYLIGAGGWAIAPHKTYEQVRAAMQQSRKVFDYEWGMAPDTQIYIYDEPGHYDCSLCEAAYLKRYGGKLPKEKTDPGYYRLMKMKGEAFIEALKLQCQVRKEVWPENTFFWGLTNEGGLLMEESLFMGRAFGGFGLDFFLNSQKGWQHQYGADVALAASDFNPESMAFQIEADSFRGAVPVAEQRGQSMYNCLATGCRTVVWWDWGLSRYKHDTGINTRRYECVKKVTLEALKLGPVLAGMKRPQGRIAMLTPNATRILGGGADAEQSRNVLVMSYKAAQVACGNIDFLYYQHLREGKLDGYKLMLLAGNDWIDEEMLDIIGKWVDAGGTLLVMPKSGNLSEELRPTRYFTEVCPVKYGEKSGTAEVKGFPGKMLFACGMESPSGEIAYSYADGKPAAYRFGKGKGLVEVFGFVPATARDLEKIFTDLKHDPVIVRCDDNDASAVLLKSGESHYCVAINSEDKAKDVELRMRIAGDGVPVALDMLTGKQIGAVRDGGTVKMRISLEPFWGRAIALLPGKPERLALEMPDKAQTGKEYVYRVRVLDSNGNLIAGRLPLEISVTDASGEVRTECGGYHVTENGVYEKKIRLGTNEPVGEWKIDVKAPWGGFKAGKLFKIVN
jgi:hypothetical protein